MNNTPKILQDMLGLLYALVLFIVEVEFNGGAGADKKAQVISKIKAVLAQPGGLELPSFLSAGVVDFLLGQSIDMLVNMLNQHNFFKSSNK